MIEETFPIRRSPGSGPLTALSEVERVLSWRIGQLVHAGYGDEEAVILACADEVELHRAIRLRKHGCPSVTALRILL